MGAEVNAQSPEPTLQEAQATLHLALQAAQQRQARAEQGFFHSPHRTCDIEQEIQCLSPQTGMPASAEALIASNALPSARFDTVTSIIEYDAGDIAALERDALSELYSSLWQRTRLIQQTLAATGEDAIVVPIGVQPLALANHWCMVPQPGLRRRYHLIDTATRRENPLGVINIASADGRAVFTEAASYMAVMMRCAGTQFHISERNVEEALSAHSISIHIAPILKRALWQLALRRRYRLREDQHADNALSTRRASAVRPAAPRCNPLPVLRATAHTRLATICRD